MNNKDRKELTVLLAKLQEVQEGIKDLAEREQEKYDNLTDALQENEKGQKLYDNASELEDISSDLESAWGRIEELINP